MRQRKICKKGEEKRKNDQERQKRRDYRLIKRMGRPVSGCAPVVAMMLHFQFITGFGYCGGGMLQHPLLLSAKL
jgi:hypothetical protein